MIRKKTQVTGGSTFVFQQGYLLSGAVSWTTYPMINSTTQRKVSREYWPNGWLKGLWQGEVGTGSLYAQVNELAASGAEKKVQLGNGALEVTTRNSRGQMTGRTLSYAGSTLWNMGLTYPAANDGNVTQQTIGRLSGDALLVQDYTYDSLARLRMARDSGVSGCGVSGVAGSQMFAYDRYGNRAVLTGSCGLTAGTAVATVAPGTPASESAAVESQFPGNRLTGMAVDGSGNVTSWYGRTLVYDGENRLRTAAVDGTTSYRYSYDGEGRRVKSETLLSGNVSATTYFVYDMDGQLAMETDGVTALGANPERKYFTVDHLGSTRVVTKAVGTAGDLVAGRYDYYPFGEEIGRTGAGYGGNGERVLFTGQVREAATGLDDFGARWMSGALGRFLSPDAPVLAQHPAEPQSWNLYTYTANNPLTRIDPDGRNWFNIGGSWQWHEGSDVNSDGDPCKKGSKGCNHSDYTHLLVFQKTGQNSKGAAVGTLTLYGNDQGKAIMSSPIFSGGGPDLGSRTLAAGDGNYRINLGRFETLQSSDIQNRLGDNGLRYGILGPHYGVQELPESLVGSSSPWGSIRARLNEWVAGGAGLPENMKGLFLHGSRDGHDYTNGCLCERSEKILRWIRDTAKNKTPGVFPTIPVLVRK